MKKRLLILLLALSFLLPVSSMAATLRMPILGALSLPDSSGDIYFDAFVNHATNDNFKQLVLVLNDDAGTKNCIYGSFNVPKNYSAGADLVIQWTGASADPGAADDVTFDFDYRAIGGTDTESLDQATFQESVTAANETAPSAAFERMTTTIDITDGNLAADDTVEFAFCRDGPNETSQYAEEVLVFDLLFQYTD